MKAKEYVEKFQKTARDKKAIVEVLCDFVREISERFQSCNTVQQMEVVIREQKQKFMAFNAKCPEVTAEMYEAAVKAVFGEDIGMLSKNGSYIRQVAPIHLQKRR
jgi:hypothetical protein